MSTLVESQTKNIFFLNLTNLNRETAASVARSRSHLFAWNCVGISSSNISIPFNTPKHIDTFHFVYCYILLSLAVISLHLSGPALHCSANDCSLSLRSMAMHSYAGLSLYWTWPDCTINTLMHWSCILYTVQCSASCAAVQCKESPYTVLTFSDHYVIGRVFLL